MPHGRNRFFIPISIWIISAITILLSTSGMLWAKSTANSLAQTEANPNFSNEIVIRQPSTEHLFDVNDTESTGLIISSIAQNTDPNTDPNTNSNIQWSWNGNINIPDGPNGSWISFTFPVFFADQMENSKVTRVVLHDKVTHSSLHDLNAQVYNDSDDSPIWTTREYIPNPDANDIIPNASDTFSEYTLFDGADPAQDWHYRIQDCNAVNSGTLNGVTLAIYYGYPQIRIENPQLSLNCAPIDDFDPNSLILMDPNTLYVPDDPNTNDPNTGDPNSTLLDHLWENDLPETTSLDSNRFSHKIISLNELEGKFRTGQDKVRVIINLKNPAQLQSTIRRKKHTSRTKLHQEINRRQGNILNKLHKADFKIRHRFKNQAGFSGEITRKGLIKLMQNPQVQTIEPVYLLEPHMRQGLSLMKAKGHRLDYDGSGTAIAIVDTGIDSSHPNLGGGGFPNSKVIGGYDFGDRDSDPRSDGHSHGTCCAGIAAGSYDNVSDYIGGVAPGAKLYSLKITQGASGSAYTADMVAAWDWCVTHQYDDPNNPIVAISTSFGNRVRHYTTCDNNDRAMTTAAKNASEAGIMVLGSSGNSGYKDAICMPACISHVVSVGAVYDVTTNVLDPNAPPLFDLEGNPLLDPNGNPQLGFAVETVTDYSNISNQLDVLAPADPTYTTDIAGAGGYSNGDYYADFNGTSAACPYAAGMLACLQSQAMTHLGRFMTVAEAKTLMLATGDPVTEPVYGEITKPRINLGRAVKYLKGFGHRGSFAIINEGSGPLTIEGIQPENNSPWLICSSQSPLVIDNGQYKVITIDVNSNHYCGASDRLFITSDDPDGSIYPDGVIVSLNNAKKGDLDFDCEVQSNDLAVLISHWLEPGAQGADLDDNGIVNLSDFALLSNNWLN